MSDLTQALCKMYFSNSVISVRQTRSAMVQEHVNQVRNA